MFTAAALVTAVVAPMLVQYESVPLPVLPAVTAAAVRLAVPEQSATLFVTNTGVVETVTVTLGES